MPAANCLESLCYVSLSFLLVMICVCVLLLIRLLVALDLCFKDLCATITDKVGTFNRSRSATTVKNSIRFFLRPRRTVINMHLSFFVAENTKNVKKNHRWVYYAA